MAEAGVGEEEDIESGKVGYGDDGDVAQVVVDLRMLATAVTLM